MWKGIKNYIQVIRMQSNVFFLALQLIDLAKKGDEPGVYYLMQVWPFLFSFLLNVSQVMKASPCHLFDMLCYWT